MRFLTFSTLTTGVIGMDNLLIPIVCAVIALMYGLFVSLWVLKLNPGNARMQEIAGAIQEGANAFMNRQYTTIAYVGVALFLIIGFGLAWTTAAGFATAAILSALA